MFNRLSARAKREGCTFHAARDFHVVGIYAILPTLLRTRAFFFHDGDDDDDDGTGPLDLLMTAMALLVGVPLLRLWWYHLQTILCKGQTTNEDMRGERVLCFALLKVYCFYACSGGYWNCRWDTITP